jgi:NAD(P)-dependent dehydrogenase (short-subunit alcohol dehydrogenase family)
MADVDGLAERSLNLQGVRALVAGAGGGIGAVVAQKLMRVGASVCIEGVSSEGFDRAAGRAIVERVVGRLGGIDLLVNCVGVESDEGDVADVAVIYERGVHQPLRRLYFLAQAVHAVMKTRGGVVINIAPAVGEAPGVVAARAAVRAGIGQLAKTMAVEWVEDGIRVNCVLPPADEDRIEDVAAFVVALASDAASRVSGETIRVDGGATAGGSWDRP